MRKMFYLLFVFYCLLSTIDCFPQSKIDSLLNVLQTTTDDTIKVHTFNRLFLQYEFSDDEKASNYLKKALELSQKIDFKKGIAKTYTNLGYFAEDKSNYPEALKNHFASLKASEAIGNKRGMGDSYNNIGNVHYSQGNYPEALKHHLISLKIRESTGDKMGIAGSYNNIGTLYYAQDNYPEALKNHFASLKIKKELGLKSGISASYNNIGVVYMYQHNYPEALKNYLASLKISEEIGNKRSMATSYNNIGLVYYDQANNPQVSPVERDRSFGQALKNHFASLKIKEAIGDNAGIAGSYANIGIVYTEQKKYKEAGEYLAKARELSKEIGNKEFLKNTYQGLAELDSAKGNFKGAYDNHKLYIVYRDSLDNEETRKKTIQSQMTFDFEKKEAVASAEHKKELGNQQALAEEKSRKQKVVLLFVVSGLLLVVVFAGFIFRSLRITRKQKKVIEQQKDLVEQQKQEVEQQKHLVEEHQKEIIDSIKYARRIQRSQLPTETYIDRTLKRLVGR